VLVWVFDASAVESKSKAKSQASAQAQANPSDKITSQSAVGAQGPTLKFNTQDAPPSSDPRPALKFNDLPNETAEQPSASGSSPSAPEEEFRSYVGYPKSQIGIINSYNNITANWDYNGQAFNFSTSALVYGLRYNLLASPMWRVGVHYSRYEVGAPEGVVSSYRIRDSSATLQQYGVDSDYCFISSKNYFRQYCVGGILMNDAYPVLKFQTGTDLVISSVQDIVAGVRFAVQIPFSDKLLFRPMIGYNYGTSLGNSGSLSAVRNSKVYFRADLPWSVLTKLDLNFHLDFESRQALVEGTNGNNQDRWATDSTVLGGGLDVFWKF